MSIVYLSPSARGFGKTFDSVLLKHLRRKGFSVVKIAHRYFGFYNYEKVAMLSPITQIGSFENVDAVVGTFVEVSLPVTFSAKAIVTPHVEPYPCLDVYLDLDDDIRREPDFQRAMLWRRFAWEVCEMYGKNKIAFIVENPVDMKIVSQRFKTFLVYPNVEVLKRVDRDVKYDVVINYTYWKSFGVRVLKKVLDLLKGYRVAVHDYHNSSAVKGLAMKYGVDFYGELLFGEYINLYSSTKLAYIVTFQEAFGARFYEIGQLTYVATNINFHDPAFPKVKYEELPEFIKSVDAKSHVEQRERVLHSVEIFNSKPLEERVGEVVDAIVSEFGLRAPELARWLG